MYVYSITSDTWLSCMLSFCSLTPNCELLFKDAQKLLWVIVWKFSDVQRLGWSNISGHPQDVTICPLCSVLGKPQTRFSAVLHKHAMWSLETYISEAMNTSVRLQICCFLHFYVTSLSFATCDVNLFHTGSKPDSWIQAAGIMVRNIS